MKKKLGKVAYKDGHESIIDLHKTCAMCPNKIIVTNGRSYKQRDDAKFCSKRCTLLFRRIEWLERRQKFNIFGKGNAPH